MVLENENVAFYNGHKVYMNGKYPAIFLNGKNQHIHRLEWIKHYGDIPENCIIHHKDHNKLNWNIDNLELLNRSQHIFEHKDKVHRKGVKVIAIKGDERVEFDSIEDASTYCGTYTSNIQRIFRGKQKTAKGWTFVKGGEQHYLL